MTFAAGTSHTSTQRWLWQYTSGYGKSSTMWRSFDMAPPHVLWRGSPGLPEGWLSSAGGLGLNDSGLVVLCLVGVPGGFALVWGSPAEVFLDTAGVVPAVDVGEDPVSASSGLRQELR